MLISINELNSQILSLKPVLSRQAGATQFVNLVANFINKVQAGPTGVPGILTYSNSIAILAIENLPEVVDMSWVINFANAIHLGVIHGSLLQGTVTDSSWTYSNVDTYTPIITNLSSALSTLISGLQIVTYKDNPAIPMATAIYNYAKSFTFQCTGLVSDSPSPPIPLPLIFNAE